LRIGEKTDRSVNYLITGHYGEDQIEEEDVLHVESDAKYTRAEEMVELAEIVGKLRTVKMAVAHFHERCSKETLAKVRDWSAVMLDSYELRLYRMREEEKTGTVSVAEDIGRA